MSRGLLYCFKPCMLLKSFGGKHVAVWENRAGNSSQHSSLSLEVTFCIVMFLWQTYSKMATKCFPHLRKPWTSFFLGKLKFQIFLLAWLLITFLIGHLLGMSLCQPIDVARIRNPELSCSSLPQRGRGELNKNDNGRQESSSLTPPQSTSNYPEKTLEKPVKVSSQHICQLKHTPNKHTSQRWYYLKNTGQHYKKKIKIKRHHSAAVSPACPISPSI